jgi:hypothetical protein
LGKEEEEQRTGPFGMKVKWGSLHEIQNSMQNSRFKIQEKRPELKFEIRSQDSKFKIRRQGSRFKIMSQDSKSKLQDWVLNFES